MNKFPSSDGMDATLELYFERNYCFYDEDTGEWLETPVLRKKGSPYSICQYTRTLIFTSLLALFLLSLVLVPLGAIVIDIFNQHTHSNFLETIQTIGNILIFFGVSIFTTNIIIQWLDDRKEKKRMKFDETLKEPGFVKTAWKNFKQKTCIPVEFK